MMEKDLIDIVVEKEFIELSPSEREEIMELCANEDEFNQMKNVLASMESMDFNVVQPAVDVKSKLDDLFHETYPKASPVWYMSVLAVVVPTEKPFLRQPLLKVAAIALLFLTVYPMLTQDITKSDVQMAEVKKEQQVENGKVIPSEKTVITETVETSNSNDNSHEEPLVHQPMASILPGSSRPSDIEDILLEDEVNTGNPATAFTVGGAAPGVDHPDGIFASAAIIESRSISAAEMPDVLDLLTSTF